MITECTKPPSSMSSSLASGHRIGVGDLIISRRNDPTLGVFDATDIDKPADPVRNGNRWRVYAIDPEHHRIAARRLSDGARTAFPASICASTSPTATPSPCTPPGASPPTPPTPCSAKPPPPPTR
jgi:hypothetical protein